MRKLLKALGLLKARFNRRLSAQQHHYTYWQHFKKRGRRGDKVRAKYHRVRFERNRKAVIKLAGLTRAKKRELRQWVKDHPKPTVASGTGPYGGSESVEREIERVVEAKRGECSGSEKRSASDPLSIANPGSDHNEANTNAYAIDFYLVNDYEIAYIVAAHFDADWAGDYDYFYAVRGGKTFRIQLIAGTHGTGPHFHTGTARS
jgi:hypothetical protein